MAEWGTVAEGQTWASLWDGRERVNQSLVPGPVYMEMVFPIPIPSFAAGLAETLGGLAGVDWYQRPVAENNRLTMMFEHHNPGFLVIIAALVSFMATLTPIIIAGTVAWTVWQIKPEQVMNLATVMVYGGLGIGALYVLSG